MGDVRTIERVGAVNMLKHVSSVRLTCRRRSRSASPARLRVLISVNAPLDRGDIIANVVCDNQFIGAWDDQSR